MSWETFLSFGLAILLGIRHGIDWDHIAAITDLVGVEKNSKQGIILATMYSLGHGLVIAILGTIAILAGKSMPAWVDFWMEKFVGITLIVLGLWLVIAIFRKHEKHMVMSRWKIIFTGAIRLYEWIYAKITRTPLKKREINAQMGGLGAFTVGVIHGFGAETPTQIILFTTAAGIGNLFNGFIVVLLFVVGLILCTSTIALFSTIGFIKARTNNKLFMACTYGAALYSLTIGLILISGNAGILPELIGK
jgi:high-affinity nickel permease